MTTRMLRSDRVSPRAHAPGGRMLTQAEIENAQIRAAAALSDAGIVLTRAEQQAIEVADFGLSALDESGLLVVVYVNTERVCAKELVLFPARRAPSTSTHRSTGRRVKRRPSAAAAAASTSTPRASRRSHRCAGRLAPTPAPTPSGTRSPSIPATSTRFRPGRCTGSRPVRTARSSRSSRPRAATSSMSSPIPRIGRATVVAD